MQKVKGYFLAKDLKTIKASLKKEEIISLKLFTISINNSFIIKYLNSCTIPLKWTMPLLLYFGALKNNLLHRCSK